MDLDRIATAAYMQAWLMRDTLPLQHAASALSATEIDIECCVTQSLRAPPIQHKAAPHGLSGCCAGLLEGTG